MIRGDNVITVVPEALEIMTVEQNLAVVGLIRMQHNIEVRKGGFDLPAGYVEFTLLYANGAGKIFGGISPEGDVST